MERTTPSVATVVLAGGSGTRLGLADGANKVYLPLAGRPLLAWSLRALYVALEPVAAVLVIRRGDEAPAAAAIAAADLDGLACGSPAVVPGGATRTASEVAGIRALGGTVAAGEVDVVLVHDGARPFPAGAMLQRLASAAWLHGAAVPGTAPPTSLAATDGERLQPVDATAIRQVQTPQAFRAADLQAALDRVERDAEAVDTASLVASAGGPRAVVVAGDPDNVKVTHPVDVARAEALAAERGWPRPSS